MEKTNKQQQDSCGNLQREAHSVEASFNSKRRAESHLVKLIAAPLAKAEVGSYVPRYEAVDLIMMMMMMKVMFFNQKLQVTVE